MALRRNLLSLTAGPPRPASPTSPAGSPRAALRQSRSDDGRGVQAGPQRQQNRREELLRRALCSPDDGFVYTNHPLRPCCHFYHFLSRRLRSPAPAAAQPRPRHNVVQPLRLRVRTPPTLLAGDTDSLTLFYTDESDLLCRMDRVTVKTLRQFFGLKVTEASILLESPRGKEWDAAAPEDWEPVAVMKRPKFGGNCNEAHCMTAQQTLVELMNPSFSQVAIIQKFVACRSLVGTITRLVWESGKGHWAYQLSSRLRAAELRQEKDLTQRFLASSDSPDGLNVFLVKGKALEDVVAMAQELMGLITVIVKPKARFLTFVADFLRDRDDVWWYIQTKAFRLVDDPVPGGLSDPDEPGRPRHVLRLRRCAVCGALRLPQELEQFVTLKMVYAAEEHLKLHGHCLPWFGRPEFKVAETPLWYQPLRACQQCFDLCLRERQLQDAELLFAQVVGVPVDAERQGVARVVEAMGRKHQQLRQATGIATLAIDAPDPALPGRHRPLSHAVLRNGPAAAAAQPGLAVLCRLLLFFHALYDVPDSLTQPLCLKAEFLQTQLVLPVRLAPPPTAARQTPLHRLRIVHFFLPHAPTAGRPAESGGRRPPLRPSETPGLAELLRRHGPLVFHLWHAGQGSVGHCKVDLQELEAGTTDTVDAVKAFTGSLPGRCSFRVTLGLLTGAPEPIPVPAKPGPLGALLPPETYFSVDPLPEYWVQLACTNPAAEGLPGGPAGGLGCLAGPRALPDWVTDAVPSPRAPRRPRRGKDQRRRKPKPQPISVDPQAFYRSMGVAIGSGQSPHAALGEYRRGIETRTGHLSVSSDLGGSRGRLGAGGGRDSPGGSAAGRASPRSRRSPKQRTLQRFTVARDPTLGVEEVWRYDPLPGGGPLPDACRKLLDRLTPPVSLWCLRCTFQAVTNLNSPPDETWCLTFQFLGQEHRYESFQLFQSGPLEFDVHQTFFFLGPHASTFPHCIKDGTLKIPVTLTQKYNALTVRHVDVALGPLLPDALTHASRSAWAGRATQGAVPLTAQTMLEGVRRCSSLSLGDDYDSSASGASKRPSHLRDLPDDAGLLSPGGMGSRQGTHNWLTPLYGESPPSFLHLTDPLTHRRSRPMLTVTTSAQHESDESDDDDSGKPQLALSLQAAKVVIDSLPLAVAAWHETPAGFFILFDGISDVEES